MGRKKKKKTQPTFQPPLISEAALDEVSVPRYEGIKCGEVHVYQGRRQAFGKYTQFCPQNTSELYILRGEGRVGYYDRSNTLDDFIRYSASHIAVIERNGIAIPTQTPKEFLDFFQGNLFYFPTGYAPLDDDPDGMQHVVHTFAKEVPSGYFDSERRLPLYRIETK